MELPLLMKPGPSWDIQEEAITTSPHEVREDEKGWACSWNVRRETVRMRGQYTLQPVYN
jgi:hypothetical protein